MGAYAGLCSKRFELSPFGFVGNAILNRRLAQAHAAKYLNQQLEFGVGEFHVRIDFPQHVGEEHLVDGNDPGHLLDTGKQDDAVVVGAHMDVALSEGTQRKGICKVPAGLRMTIGPYLPSVAVHVQNAEIGTFVAVDPFSSMRTLDAAIGVHQPEAVLIPSSEFSRIRRAAIFRWRNHVNPLCDERQAFSAREALSNLEPTSLPIIPDHPIGLRHKVRSVAFGSRISALDVHKGRVSWDWDETA